jgi:hypothetical protein
MNATDEILKVADGTVRLRRNVKFMNGTQETGAGDRMIVEHLIGNEEAVVIIQENGKQKVKRLVPQSTTVGPALSQVEEACPERSRRVPIMTLNIMSFRTRPLAGVRGTLRHFESPLR